MSPNRDSTALARATIAASTNSPVERHTAVPSIGSVGDSYDNALAEAVNALYKTELIRQQGPWKSVDDIELATLSWVTWFNTARLHETLGDIPPSEYEAAYYRHEEETNQPVEIR